jgi:hypothetical protein
MRWYSHSGCSNEMRYAGVGDQLIRPFSRQERGTHLSPASIVYSHLPTPNERLLTANARRYRISGDGDGLPVTEVVGQQVAKRPEEGASDRRDKVTREEAAVVECSSEAQREAGEEGFVEAA